MRLHIVSGVLAVALLGIVLPVPLSANVIERACLQSDRPGVSYQVCRCIGDAANLTLSPSDMRTGSRFFRDPGRAQDVQLSDTRRNDAFWERWQNFGETAEALCS